MAKVEITMVRHYLDWSFHQTINQADLMTQLGVHATGVNGEDLTNKVVLNLTQVNIDQQGEYPVALSVMDASGQTAQESVTLHVPAGWSGRVTDQVDTANPNQEETLRGNCYPGSDYPIAGVVGSQCP